MLSQLDEIHQIVNWTLFCTWTFPAEKNWESGERAKTAVYRWFDELSRRHGYKRDDIPFVLRVEYGSRGKLHVHGLVGCVDLPEYARLSMIGYWWSICGGRLRLDPFLRTLGGAKYLEKGIVEETRRFEPSYSGRTILVSKACYRLRRSHNRRNRAKLEFTRA